MAARAFRFGVTAAGARTGTEWVEKARRVEALGYTTLVVPDNVQHTLAPFPALAVAATATNTLRVGTYVLVNDYRNPVLLAKEAASLDLLTGGRFELGLGAGRPAAAAEAPMLGLDFASGGERVARLAEALALIKPLLAGERVSATGPHYAVSEATISPLPVQKPRPPLLVAGSGPRLLALAAREADIVALGVPRDATEAEIAEKVSAMREAAGGRFGSVELGLSVVAVAGQVSRWIAAQRGAGADALATSDGVCVLRGDTEAMCDTLERRRDTLGISYLLVGEDLMEAFAPIVARPRRAVRYVSPNSVGRTGHAGRIPHMARRSCRVTGDVGVAPVRAENSRLPRRLPRRTRRLPTTSHPQTQRPLPRAVCRLATPRSVRGASSQRGFAAATAAARGGLCRVPAGIARSGGTVPTPLRCRGWG